jgi:hypothetical protein
MTKHNQLIFRGDKDSEHHADQELRYDGHTWHLHDWQADETHPVPEHHARRWLLKNHLYNVVTRFWPGEAERYIEEEEQRVARVHRDIAESDAHIDAWIRTR